MRRTCPRLTCYGTNDIIPVVGLTGGIATGKSSVSKELSAYGVPLVDLDILARKAVARGSPALTKIAAEFGADILRDDGELDREALGRIVFADEARRHKLNAIVHPAVRRLCARELLRHWLRGERFVVVDSPLLIEAGLWKLCGWIVVVWCSPQDQYIRLRARNPNLSEQEARDRIDAQRPVADKLVYADSVIDNSGSHEHRSSQVDILVSTLRRRAGWLSVISWLVPPVGILCGALRVAYRLWILRVGKSTRIPSWRVLEGRLQYSSSP